MLSDKIACYEAAKENLRTTPAKYKEEFPWLKEVDSLALANAQMHLETAYKNFFRDKATGFPTFKSKHRSRVSYTTNLVNSNISIENGQLKLPKLGFLKVKQHRKAPKSWRMKSVTVSKTPSGKYHASILYEYKQEIHSVKPQNIVGLDFSMKELFVSSDEQLAAYPRFYRKAQEKLSKEQRKLSKCRKASKNRKKQRIKVARLHEKVANQRKDFLHKLSRQTANAYDIVCIEDLDMKGMAQALNLGKSVSDNGWGIFTGYLAYKLAEQGKQLVKIDKWYPSSKTCSICGKAKEEMPLAEREYRCSCGLVLDRDTNAAINIRNEGCRMIGIA
jgi:putative transposase